MAFSLFIHQYSKQQTPIFSNLNWEIQEHENWAILGNIGTGKTLLLKILSGLEFLSSTDGSLVFSNRLNTKDIEYISFSDDRKWIKQSNFYYQQRYYTTYSDEEMALVEFLQLQELTVLALEKSKLLLDKYHLSNLLSVPFIQLSNGQKNKAILVKALQSTASVFLLDNPFIGIDSMSRNDIFNLIDTLILQGKQVIYTTNYPDFATSTTHILSLEKDRKYTLKQRSDFKPTNQQEKKIGKKNVVHPSNNNPIIELQNVSISYHQKKILDNINWTVFSGEKWAIIGENGSGKSTLMSLLYADHPQAYHYDIRLFGQARKTQSIWEIKAKTGYLSPEFHLHFNEPLNVMETIGTGYSDTLTLLKSLTSNQQQHILQTMEELAIAHLKLRYFNSLSFGEQRLVLFARAIIKQPELLILDEPYQSLDEQSILRCNRWLCASLQEKQTLIFTSHYTHEIPDNITHFLNLNKGKIITHE